MGISGESGGRILLVTVAMAIAAGAMLMRIVQGDGEIWVVVSAVGFLVVGALGVIQLLSRRRWT